MPANMTRARSASFRRAGFLSDLHGGVQAEVDRIRPCTVMRSADSVRQAARCVPPTRPSIAQASTSENTRVAKRFESVPALITPTDFRSSAYNAISFLNASPMG